MSGSCEYCGNNPCVCDDFLMRDYVMKEYVDNLSRALTPHELSEVTERITCDKAEAINLLYMSTKAENDKLRALLKERMTMIKSCCDDKSQVRYIANRTIKEILGEKG